MLNRFELLTLPNGVNIWHCRRMPRSLEPYFAIEVNFNFGSRDLPSEELGLAHFLEHQIFNVGDFPSWDLRNFFFKNGGYLNAYTSPDDITIEARIPASKTALLLPLLVGMISEPILGRDLEREKGVVLSEFGKGNRPYEMCRREDAATAEYFSPFLARVHSRITALGTPETISAFSEERLDYYWRNRFRKSVSSVVIAGEFDLNMISEQFSNLKTQSKFKRPLFTGPWYREDRRRFAFEGEQAIFPRENFAFAVTFIPVDGWQHSQRLILKIGCQVCNELNELQAREREALAYSVSHNWLKRLDHVRINWDIPGDPARLERAREILQQNIVTLLSPEDFERARASFIFHLLHEERNTSGLCSNASVDLAVIGNVADGETTKQVAESLSYEEFARFWTTHIINGRFMLGINRS